MPKSLLKQDQFGGSFGGPLVKNKAFFFGSFERYRLNAGINIVEATPSSTAWGRATPAIAALRPGFLAPGAIILPGQSTNPDFDIAQLQTPQIVSETAASGRFDIKMNNRWSSYVRVFHDRGVSDAPDSVSGRVVHTEANPSNAIFNLQGVLSDRTTNEFKFGYNAAPTQIAGVVPDGAGALSAAIINLTGSVANNGIAGQGSSSGITVPGGLVRSNSAQNGRAQPYDPYTLSFIDSLGSLRGNHYIKVGGEVRLIRMSIERRAHHARARRARGPELDRLFDIVGYIGALDAGKAKAREKVARGRCQQVGGLGAQASRQVEAGARQLMADAAAAPRAVHGHRSQQHA